MATLPSPSIGAMVRRYRTAAGLTQQDLAERVDVSVRTISNVERDVPHRFRRQMVARLLEALQVTPQDRAVAEAMLLRRAGPAPAAGGAPAARGLPLPPLVGRSREIALLERYLDGNDAPAGSAPLLLLAGEPGIGKSRLLHEATVLAVSRGMRVLTAGCQRREGQDPYAPLSEALKRHLDGQPAGRLRAHLEGCAWLVRVLPELAAVLTERLPPATLPPEQERRLIHEALVRFLANVATPCGLALVLDDVQWAGADALDALASLARASAGSPSPHGRLLRILGAYRDNEAPPGSPLSVLLADLAHAGLAEHHTLEPLSPAASRQLLDGLLEGVEGVEGIGTEVRGRVLQRAGGVPFYMVSLVQALHAGSAAGAGRDGVPWNITQSVRQRVAALPEPARDVLGAAAVIGRWAPRSLLTAVVTRPEDEVLDGLEAACRAHLLEEDPAGDAYLFAHDVIREVIEAELSAGRRTVLHRRVAVALEAAATGRNERDRPVEALAFHYGRSDDGEKAILYLEAAGDRARAQAALAAAAGYYRELADRLHALGRVHDEARAEEKLGFALHTHARYAEAVAAFERAAELYRAAGDLDGQGRVTAQMGFVFADRGMVEEGIARVRALLEPLDEASAWPALSALYNTLAGLLFFSGRYDEHLPVAERALELARRVGDEALVANAESARATGLLMRGRGPEALQAFAVAASLAESAGDLACLCMALTNLATIYMYGGALDEALRHAERAIAVAMSRGDPLHIALMRLKRAIVCLFIGNWRQAHQDIEWIIGLSGQTGASWSFAYPWLVLGTLHLLEGNWEEGVPYLERSIAFGARSGDLEVQRWAHSRLAEHDILAGQPAAARDRIVPVLDRVGMEEVDVTVLLPRLAWAYLELGDVAQAAATIAQAIERAGRQQHRIALADALWVQAMVATRQGTWSEAEQALQEGLALVRAMPYPYAEARLLHAYGEMHARAGEPKPARERLEAALSTFRQLGARRDVERLERALAGLGWS